MSNKSVVEQVRDLIPNRTDNDFNIGYDRAIQDVLDIIDQTPVQTELVEVKRLKDTIAFLVSIMDKHGIEYYEEDGEDLITPVWYKKLVKKEVAERLRFLNIKIKFETDPSEIAVLKFERNVILEQNPSLKTNTQPPATDGTAEELPMPSILTHTSRHYAEKDIIAYRQQEVEKAVREKDVVLKEVLLFLEGAMDVNKQMLYRNVKQSLTNDEKGKENH